MQVDFGLFKVNQPRSLTRKTSENWIHLRHTKSNINKICFDTSNRIRNENRCVIGGKVLGMKIPTDSQTTQQ